jgi:hypothetical protein
MCDRGLAAGHSSRTSRGFACVLLEIPQSNIYERPDRSFRQLDIPLDIPHPLTSYASRSFPTMSSLFWRSLAILTATVVALEQTVLPGFASRSVEHPALVQGFDTPSVEHRPKFRYWFAVLSSLAAGRLLTSSKRLPDANVDHNILADDIRALKDIGAGGLEFIPFYNYGFGSPDISNWDVYAFGKPAFKDVLLTALESCRANGLVMDFALGASQGQGVPVEPLTPGLAVQLVYGKTTVRGGEQFQGDLPAPMLDWRQVLGFMQSQELFGDSRLIGVSAAAVTSSKLLKAVVNGSHPEFTLMY